MTNLHDAHARLHTRLVSVADVFMRALIMRALAVPRYKSSLAGIYLSLHLYSLASIQSFVHVAGRLSQLFQRDDCWEPVLSQHTHSQDRPPPLLPSTTIAMKAIRFTTAVLCFLPVSPCISLSPPRVDGMRFTSIARFRVFGDCHNQVCNLGLMSNNQT